MSLWACCHAWTWDMNNRTQRFSLGRGNMWEFFWSAQWKALSLHVGYNPARLPHNQAFNSVCVHNFHASIHLSRVPPRVSKETRTNLWCIHANREWENNMNTYTILYNIYKTSKHKGKYWKHQLTYEDGIAITFYQIQYSALCSVAHYIYILALKNSD